MIPFKQFTERTSDMMKINNSFESWFENSQIKIVENVYFIN